MILVTGGTGLLGSHLLLELVREHEEVIAVKRPSSDLEEVKKVFAYHSSEAADLFRLIDWVDLDLESDEEVERAMIDVDRIFHCAAQVSFQPGDARRMIKFNANSTANVVRACQVNGGTRLVHVSSSSAIGKAPDGLPANEEMIWGSSKNNSAYSVSKFRSEMEVWRGMEEGLDAVIVNPTIILGPGFWDQGSSAIVSRVAGGLKYSTPGRTGYVGVGDVVRAMTSLMESDIKDERFILSAGDYSYAEIMEMIAAALGKPRVMKLLSPSALRSLARLDGIKGFFTGKRSLTSVQAKSAFSQTSYSNEKIGEAIGFEFTPLEQVVKEVVRHYQAK